ncbi:MAG: arginase, partial [Gallicola sp.]|nr:arginase [Gallicola sp.]
RYAGLEENIKKLGYKVVDEGDIISEGEKTDNPRMKNFDPIYNANKELFNKVSEVLEKKAFPVILGGDHSIAAGSIAATTHHFDKIGIIWIDAHSDFNSDESTISGNMHGMPLSSLTGFGPDSMVDFGKEKKFVDPKNVAIIGVRDIDPEEKIRLSESGIHVFTIHDIDKLGMSTIIEKAIKAAGDGTDGIHVSFDMDSITPEEAPGVGTPVHSGLTVREAFLAVELIAQSGKVLAVDMVEVNPILDVANKTAIIASELILAILGEVVY